VDDEPFAGERMSTIIFWISVGWVVYVYAGYLLILGLYTLAIRVRPLKRIDYFPSVSVLISARNEEKDIRWKVLETLTWDYPAEKLEVLVASDASDDRTDEILHALQDPRLRVFRMAQRGGKCRALNHLAQQAAGEILFFTDANAQIGPDCLSKIVRHFADARVGCVTGDSYSVKEPNEQPIAAGASVYWSYESLIKRLESRVGSVLVCDGAVFGMRQSLYVPVAPDLANDLELPLHVGHAGYWILHEPDARVLERDTSSPRQEFARRRRICSQGALGMWRLRRTLQGSRGWQFSSRKLLRWLTLIPMLAILASTAGLVANPWFAAFFALQAAFYLAGAAALVLAATGRGAGRVLSVPLYVLLGSAGALVGVWDACRGRRFDVWEIPTLSRGQSENQSWGAY